MMTEIVNKVLQLAGYRICRMQRCLRPQANVRTYPPIHPVWPLPRRPNGPADEDIRKEFGKFAYWHYAYSFDGNLSFPVRHSKPSKADVPDRHFQRFRHFMPYVVGAEDGSLRGKRVLDIACNSGFWSIQCALMGAEVVGFDARPELIEQANLIKSIVGVDNAEFKVLDFWDMNPQTLGGTFDVVLNLGVLFHLPKPLEVLERTRAVARKHILLDTTLNRIADPVVVLGWEEVVDIRSAATSGINAVPSQTAIELMLRHLGVAEWVTIPVRTNDIPSDYLTGQRASWLITV